MQIPDFQAIMLPLLKLTATKNNYTLKGVIENLSNHFALTEEEKQMLLSSGTKAIFDSRVSWAKTYLRKAGLIYSPKKGEFRITKYGLKFLSEKPKEITIDTINKLENSRKNKYPTANLDELIKYSKSNDRIIPCPIKWTELWQMLPDLKRSGDSWNPLPPLILGAWAYSTEQSKQERFFYHLRYAAKKDVLDKVSFFLINLSEFEWCHTGEAGYNLDLEYNYSYEEFAPKDRPAKEVLLNSLQLLNNNWSNIAGKLISNATQPIKFSGDKARRLIIKVLNENIIPPWGSWWSLEKSNNPKSFTDFRAKINENIFPHSIDHIVFFQKGKRSK